MDLDLRSLTAIAEAVVDESEAMFVRGLGAAPSLDKGNGDFATEVDLAIEAQLREQLTAMTGIPVFGEEAGGNVDATTLWVVDPIDGTANYAAGNPLCAILVSLVHREQPLIGITSIPLVGKRLVAYDGSPLFINGQAAPRLRERPDITTHVGLSTAGVHPTGALFTRLYTDSTKPRLTGSVGVDLAFHSEGIFGGAISLSPHIWDNAAGVVLLRAAGATVTDTAGNPWTTRSRGVVAGTPRIHRLIMDAITAVEGPLCP